MKADKIMSAGMPDVKSVKGSKVKCSTPEGEIISKVSAKCLFFEAMRKDETLQRAMRAAAKRALASCYESHPSLFKHGDVCKMTPPKDAADALPFGHDAAAYFALYKSEVAAIEDAEKAKDEAIKAKLNAKLQNVADTLGMTLADVKKALRNSLK